MISSFRLFDNSRTYASSAATAAAAAKTLKDTYGNDVVNERTAEGDFLQTRDKPRAGCSKKLNSEQLQVAADENPTCTTRELSTTFHVSRHMTTYWGMKILKGWPPTLPPPYDLSEINKQQRVVVVLCFTAFS
ncbi:hypothetical protein ACTXT7_001032 [Hymenolepis weldensis]